MRIIYNDSRLYLSLTRDEQELIHDDYYNQQTKPLELPMSYLNVLHKDVFDAVHKRYKEIDERYRPEAYVVESSKETNN
jgi:hypothetical protein|tara:strand:- start:1339 stop:1575 length:237 start_codon:yes stop_codon:yes gene_type:complete